MRKSATPRTAWMWPWGSTGTALRRILRDEQPDLVEISDKWSLPIIGGLLRVAGLDGIRRPAVVGTSHERLHDNMSIYLKLGAVGDWMSRTMLKRYYWLMFDHHVANSQYTAGELLPASRGHGVYRPLHVLPMGVDTDGLDPANRTPQARVELADRLGLPAELKLLVYVGRLAHEKNLPLLTGMLTHLSREYHLLMAGEGPLRNWLENECSRLSGRIHLLGHLNGRTELAKLYSGADIFVHPNAKEPFGIAPLEAMAAGVPLVASATGGVRSYASERDAWIANPDAASFAESVLAVAANPGEARARCPVARKTAIDHSWPRVAASFFRFWDDILNGVEFEVLDDRVITVAREPRAHALRPGTA